MKKPRTGWISYYKWAFRVAFKPFFWKDKRNLAQRLKGTCCVFWWIALSPFINKEVKDDKNRNTW